MTMKVYSLKDEKNRIRYIGVTRRRLLSHRLSEHMRDARSGKKSPRAVWIRSMLKRGLRPTIHLIEDNQPEAALKFIEQIYIDKYKSRLLTNSPPRNGGGGVVSRQCREAAITARTGSKHSEATRELMRQRKREFLESPKGTKWKRKMSRTRKGRIPWNKGLTTPQNVRDKQRASALRRHAR